MPRLKCTYSEFIAIIEAHGFKLLRHDGSSHQRWQRRNPDGTVNFVDICGHSKSADIPLGTLQAMIRQSGLPKKLFRK